MPGTGHMGESRRSRFRRGDDARRDSNHRRSGTRGTIFLVDAPGKSGATIARWLAMLRGVRFVEVTASGNEALALLGSGKPAQVVLVDSQLSDMDVFEFVHRVPPLLQPS
jgi:hypothetical protein